MNLDGDGDGDATGVVRNWAKRLSSAGAFEPPSGLDLTHVVFVLTEFQIADKATALRNESGASSHEAYKARQHERVRMRLFRDKDDPLPPD